MPTPIKIANLSDDIDVKIRPISGYWEFEQGVFAEQTNFYFGDKTNQDNPFLASIEIEHLGEKHWINYKLFGASIQSQLVEENKLKYSTSDYDVEYEVLNGQLKEKIILNNPIAKREFKFTLKLSQWLEYKLENNEVIFFDIRTDTSLLKIPAPTMVDAVGRESSGLSYVFGMEGEYKSLSVVVDDEEFLSNAIYPVLIDPTTINIISSIITESKTSQNTVVSDNSGNKYIVFGQNYNIYVRKILPNNTVQVWNGTTWTTSGEVSIHTASIGGFTGDFTYNQNSPSIIIDSSQILHVVWNGKNTTESVIQIKHSKFNTLTNISWVYSGSIFPTSYTQATPVIDIDSTGKLHVLFHGVDATPNTGTQIHYGYYDTSWHLWNTNGLIKPSGVISQNYPTIAIDNNNEVLTVFKEGNNPYYTYFGRLSGGSWTFTDLSTKGVTNTGVTTTGAHNIGVDSQNNVHIVVGVQSATVFGSYINCKNNVWSTPKDIRTTEAYLPRLINVFADSSDKIWIAFSVNENVPTLVDFDEIKLSSSGDTLSLSQNPYTYPTHVYRLNPDDTIDIEYMLGNISNSNEYSWNTSTNTILLPSSTATNTKFRVYYKYSTGTTNVVKLYSTYSSDGGNTFNACEEVGVDKYLVSMKRDKFFGRNKIGMAVKVKSNNYLEYTDITPLAPTISGFTANATDYKTIACSWTNSETIGNAKIYNSPNTLLKTFNGNVTNGTLLVPDDIATNATYNLYVVITNSSLVSSDPSPTQEVTLTLPPPTLSGTAQSSSRILWSFNQYSDIVEYILYNASDTRIGRLVYEGGVWKAYWGYPVETLQATYATPQIEQSRISTSTTLNPGTNMTLKVTSKYGIYESAKDAETKTTFALPTYNEFLGIINDINNITWKIDRL